MKKLLFSVMVLGVMASCLMAMSGATIGTPSPNRWNGSVNAGSVTTEGGNITSVDISSVQLTSKWAAFFGNISGAIILSDTNSITTAVYVWTYATSAGGKVCISNNTDQVFTNITNATFANIDSKCGTAGLPDDAAGTFATSCPALTLTNGNLTNFIASRHAGGSSFTTCAATTNNGTAATDHIFCTNINSSGTNYLGAISNYEIIVPAGARTTYSFYAELA